MAPTYSSTLSLPDALPIYPCPHRPAAPVMQHGVGVLLPDCRAALDGERAEPQPRLEAVHASALGPGGHAAGEALVVAQPVAPPGLVAVVKLHERQWQPLAHLT